MVLKDKFKVFTRESTDLLHKANRLTEDIQGKSDRLNSVVDAVKGIGDSVQTLNGSVDRVTNSITPQYFSK
ncbi:General stress protein-like protein [Staphylococcus gallinarum]|uniref:General stress protein-like protein n=1 Tax=Staphylococcus gallinarum TaxID=1293 RepID=A0A380FJ11_STAGA|nr:General stress protein-like protein [Staphylococcus gallinarum]